MADLQRLSSTLADCYRIERELGAGGMATVYLAHDIRHGRDVAIKVLRSDVSEALGRERFLREIRLAASLTHPHILSLYDSGDAGGTLWFTMPLMRATRCCCATVAPTGIPGVVLGALGERSRALRPLALSAP